MGVYYIIANDSKREMIDPFCFDENFKFGGLLQGLHGSAIARMLVESSNPARYSWGYWSGDRIRIVGDGADDDAYLQVTQDYTNISYPALALEFECGTGPTRETILLKAKTNREILKGLYEANHKLNLVNLTYSLKKLTNG